MAANPQQTGSEDLQPASADIAKDKDQQETREWMDALSAVIESEGPERAHFLLEQLLEHAREKSIGKLERFSPIYVAQISRRQWQRYCAPNFRRRYCHSIKIGCLSP